jgi:hypothetical protein
MLAAAVKEAWRQGAREPIEIVFDEHVIFGERARNFYPLLREMARWSDQERASLLPVTPVFRADDVALPLQAADFFATYWRTVFSGDMRQRSFRRFALELETIEVSGFSIHRDAVRLASEAASADPNKHSVE